MTGEAKVKSKVFKMAGVWLWTCDHEGSVGDEFRSDLWRDPWTAALVAASKHAVQFHNSALGEEIG